MLPFPKSTVQFSIWTSYQHSRLWYCQIWNFMPWQLLLIFYEVHLNARCCLCPHILPYLRFKSLKCAPECTVILQTITLLRTAALPSAWEEDAPLFSGAPPAPLTSTDTEIICYISYINIIFYIHYNIDLTIKRPNSGAVSLVMFHDVL